MSCGCSESGASLGRLAGVPRFGLYRHAIAAIRMQPATAERPITAFSHVGRLVCSLLEIFVELAAPTDVGLGFDGGAENTTVAVLTDVNVTKDVRGDECPACEIFNTVEVTILVDRTNEVWTIMGTVTVRVASLGGAVLEHDA